MRTRIYSIRINPKTWEKYQGKQRKKGYRSIMLSERFLDDDKIMSLKASEVLLYLSCLLVASQSNTGECQVNAKLLSSHSRVKPGLISSCLRRLQSFQLLSYDFSDTLIEPKLKEVKLREDKTKAKESEPDPVQVELELSDRTSNQASATGVADRLLRVWNENRGSLKECRAFNSDRRRKAQARWREKPDEEFWKSLVKSLATSGWHCGKNDRGWVASIDFILKPDTWVRHLEGSLGGRVKTEKRLDSKTGQMVEI